MIELLEGFPAPVLAVSARDRVTAEDYREILTPAVEALLTSHEKIRLLYHLGPEFKRFTTTALWDDARPAMLSARKLEFYLSYLSAKLAYVFEIRTAP